MAYRIEQPGDARVHVISQKRLREFWAEHPGSEAPLRAWYRVADRSSWRSFAEVRATCANSVDQVDRCSVFNIGGNKYRLVVRIEYQWGRIYVLHVLTHKEYDRGSWKSSCG